MTTPDAVPGSPLAEPANESEMWTNVDYAIAAAEDRLARTHYVGDALPFFDPWLGPDQFAAWLGAEMTIRPKEFTSWIVPLVCDWADHPEFHIDPENRWWTLYLKTLRQSVEAGRGKWVTAFPDLHTGIDALSALRGPQQLSLDLLADPETIHRVMRQMTALWKRIVDTVDGHIGPGGQGSTNWTGGWSEKRFLCIGQNDFSCMISPDMFRSFCIEDTIECIEHVDYALYHLDGPGALRHLPEILDIERLHTVQWVYGNGNPMPSHWLDMLHQIQDAGKAIQVWYNLTRTARLADVFAEIEILCSNLDVTRLFIGADLPTVDDADAVFQHTRNVCRDLRPTQVSL